MSVSCDARDTEGLFVTVRSRRLRSFGDISLDLLLIVKKSTLIMRCYIWGGGHVKVVFFIAQVCILIEPNQDLY